MSPLLSSPGRSIKLIEGYGTSTLGQGFGSSSGGGAATCSLHIVPNSGSASNSNRIFDLDIALKETILLEPAYPIVLETTGESLQADAGVNTVNIVVNGDVEV